jgi:four helix bundle protein
MNNLKYEDLEVYKLAEKLSDRIWQIVIGWNYTSQKTYGLQIIDSSASIGSNIAKGYGRGSNPGSSQICKNLKGIVL